MTKENLLVFCYPGLYEIYCEQTKRSYFGQTENVISRLGRHFNDLEAQNHEVCLLQRDWVLFGRDAFSFRIVICGLEWKSKTKRLLGEKQLIDACDHKVYNKLRPTLSTYRKEWTFEGVTYLSGAQAARRLGISETAVSRLMKREGSLRFVPNCKPVSIEDKFFSSVNEASSMLGISRSTLVRRLRSSTFPTWVYQEKTRSNDYPERE